MSLRSFENQAGMLAIVMMGSRDVLMTKLEIQFAIDKFGNYGITNVKKGKEVVFNTDLPYQLYQIKKDTIRSRRNQMS